eukprot:4966467-Amphidinium_carterae.1
MPFDLDVAPNGRSAQRLGSRSEKLLYNPRYCVTNDTLQERTALYKTRKYVRRAGTVPRANMDQVRSQAALMRVQGHQFSQL